MFLLVMLGIGLLFGWKAAAVMFLPLLGVQALATLSNLGQR